MTDHSSVDGEKRAFRADDTHKGWRLDHFLAVSLKELSRSRLQALIAQGRVTLAGETIWHPHNPAKPAASLSVFLPPPASPDPQPQVIPLAIAREASDLICLRKPP